VVHDAPVGLLQLHAAYPDVFLQIRWNRDIAVGHRAIGGHVKRLLHLEDQIRRTD
jgi:hypothetical protein